MFLKRRLYAQFSCRYVVVKSRKLTSLQTSPLKSVINQTVLKSSLWSSASHELGNISCYYRQAPPPHLLALYSHSRITIKWSLKMNCREKVKFHFLEILGTYIFFTVGLNDWDFIQVVSEQHLWISERSQDSRLSGCVDCLQNNCQFEESIELLTKRPRLWVTMVTYSCRTPSAELDLMGQITTGPELQLCFLLPSLPWEILCVSVGHGRVPPPSDSTQSVETLLNPNS